MRVIGVWPAAAARHRGLLLGALGSLVDVRFEPLDGLPAGPDDLDGLILFATEDRQESGEPRALPRLVFDPEPGAARASLISFTDSPRMDPRLRGQAVSGKWSPWSGTSRAGCEVLATAGAEPVWMRRRDEPCDLVSVELPDLVPGERLRDRVRPGDCLGMIAILHFIRGVFGQEWTPPATRACIVIDDPNTRRPSYGHIDYSALSRHASEFEYHVTFAQIPLDLAFFDRRTVALFQTNSDRLSLALHGNDHTHHELAAPRLADEADRMLAQALRRAARFEKRSGLEVGRVMVPPHESCSGLVAREMARLGFESLTLTKPQIINEEHVTGFEAAEVTESGMPVLVRRRISEHEDAVLRGFLDQPLVLYGHEPDFRDGLGFLEEAAAVVNRMPHAFWGSLSSLSRSNFLLRKRGDQIDVRPFGRRIHVVVEPDVRAVVVEPFGRPFEGSAPEFDGSRGNHVRVPDSSWSTILLDPHELEVKLEIQLVSDGDLAPEQIPSPRFRAGPIVRRLASETRDRSHPLRNRIGTALAREAS